MCESSAPKTYTVVLPWREYFCQSGYFLQIDPGGEVSGASRSGHKHAVFEVTSVTCGVIGLKAVHSCLYLAVDEKGRAHGQAHFDESCELVEKFDPSGRYTVFQPRRFAARGWHLALGRQGQARPAHKIDDDQKCAWFLPKAVDGGQGLDEDSDANVDSDLLEEWGFKPGTGLGS